MNGFPVCLHDLITLSSRRGGEIAIEDGSRSIAFNELFQCSVELARDLKCAGVQKGDRVCIYLPHCIEYCISVFAISMADAVFVPLNDNLKTAQIEFIAENCDAKLIIYASQTEKNIKQFDFKSSTYFLNDIEFPSSRATMDSVESTAIGKDLAAIIYTSGSTGKPKGVMLSHDNLIAGSRIVSSYLKLNCSDRVLSLLPFSFDYGLNQLLTCVQVGARLSLANFRLGDDITRLIENREITGLAGVPTIWSILARATPSLKTTDFSSLRYITNTGGHFSRKIVDELRSCMPGTMIYLMYGLTEAFRSTYLPPEMIDLKPDSIGIAIPESEILVINDDGKLCGPDQIGVLVHRGPTVSMGYWNDWDATQKVLKQYQFSKNSFSHELVCVSGDYVKKDADGYLYFVGRKDALIKSAGFRISPEEVEDVINGIDGVQHSAVFGVKDEFLGQKLCAAVVFDSSKIGLGEIKKKAGEILPSHMRLSVVKPIEFMPKLSNGKLDYVELKKRFMDSNLGVA